MPACESLHQKTEVSGFVGGIDDQMHMIRHKAVSVDLQAELAPKLLERFEIGGSIVIREGTL
jgi:hypothetical protein